MGREREKREEKRRGSKERERESTESVSGSTTGAINSPSLGWWPVVSV